jgi:hypothetical protein
VLLADMAFVHCRICNRVSKRQPHYHMSEFEWSIKMCGSYSSSTNQYMGRTMLGS